MVKKSPTKEIKIVAQVHCAYWTSLKDNNNMVPTQWICKKYEKLNHTYMGNGIFLNAVMVYLPSSRFKLYVTGEN
jgi:hypothetical protein